MPRSCGSPRLRSPRPTIGSNAEAARLSGVNTKAMIYVAYVISAFCAAFAGVLLGTRIGIGNPTQGEGWECRPSHPR
jgi:ribose transport system permease protein